MQYSKPPLTFPEQADLLLSRGLTGDKDVIISRLRAVSYYRLSGYWYPFRNPDSTIQAGTDIDKIWQRYVFDRRLRMLVMDAIERVEVAVRTDVVYNFSHQYGSFAYQDNANLPHLSRSQHERFLGQIAKETRRSKEVFVNHFKNRYGDQHPWLPLWMATEIMTFGGLLTLFRGLDAAMKKKITKQYGVADTVFNSWLLALNGIRNVCAHHGRLWNRELGYKPMIPRGRKHPQWHEPVEVKNNRVFCILSILQYLVKQIAPQSNWQGRLNELLAESPQIPLIPMGFPENWRDCPVWEGLG